MLASSNALTAVAMPSSAAILASRHVKVPIALLDFSRPINILLFFLRLVDVLARYCYCLCGCECGSRIDCVLLYQMDSLGYSRSGPGWLVQLE